MKLGLWVRRSSPDRPEGESIPESGESVTKAQGSERTGPLASWAARHGRASGRGKRGAGGEAGPGSWAPHRSGESGWTSSRGLADPSAGRRAGSASCWNLSRPEAGLTWRGERLPPRQGPQLDAPPRAQRGTSSCTGAGSAHIRTPAFALQPPSELSLHRKETPNSNSSPCGLTSPCTTRLLAQPALVTLGPCEPVTNWARVKTNF